MREIIERVARCFHDWVFVASAPGVSHRSLLTTIALP
jgi:hypothetical protein